MMKIHILNVRKTVAVFIAMMLMILSVSYSGNKSEATSSTRTYWRHDYNSSNLASHYEYTLTVDSNDNTNYNSRTIFPPNNMVRDCNEAVVRLDGIGGTGFIIDDHVIATAAHCVYSQQDDRFINFQVSIIDKNNNVLKTISPKYAHINAKFSEYNNYGGDSKLYDYALIYVDEDLSEHGKFDLGVACNSYVDNRGSVIVSGFPQIYPDNYSGLDWGIRFKASGNLIPNPSLYMLTYDADMTNGDSGGPVYVEEGVIINDELYEYRTVVAINVCQNSSYNSGLKMTAEVLKFYGANPYKTV